ncbi:ribonuclease HII [Dissulfurirhabdus thermomarina]|uniref:Ribonuclease HII n=1 Tax=Dissulfurirhabdus thermomarina TaxID=1765737 RepID=A0A6N9TR52_DISTH|nr:ribonuclease HII [Dissulfurirhabdus thermomarina]NDY42583.1 ribonuclease HII [Dissulfurirhabdus thermomarina]
MGRGAAAGPPGLFPEAPRAGVPTLAWEARFREQGLDPVAGVDEVGRGCLAGPVVAAAVILPPGIELPGVRDSKTLPPGARRRLDAEIRSAALGVALGQAGPEEIDRMNILRASLLAMARAVEALRPRPRALLVDGNQGVPCALPQKTLVGGDGRSLSIAAASIVAKVHRDRLMEEWDRRFPCYNFAGHKGYATREHRAALRRHGPCPIHRRSFRGVAG